MPLAYFELMARGYLLTVLLEGMVLFIGLRQLTLKQRLFLSFWLTAITYPFVWLVFPFIFDNVSNRTALLVAAEVFAPAAECLAYKFAMAGDKPWRSREVLVSFAVITSANLFSFVAGMLLPWWH